MTIPTTIPSQGTRAHLPVSVVIPVYNGAEFLAEALTSVRGQTCAPAEVIVVDNGSTDESPVIARAAGVKLLYLPKAGVSAARNFAIRQASQPWIAFLDADDLWEPRKLELQWMAVENCPDVALIITDFSEFDSKGQRTRSFLSTAKHYQAVTRAFVASSIQRCDPDSFQAHFLQGNFIAPSSVLIRRELLVRIGLFDEGLTHCEDRELWLRALPTATVAVVEEPLVKTRMHASNASNSQLLMARGGALVAERVLSHPHRYPPGAPEFYRACRPYLHLNVGRFAEEIGDMRQARTHYLYSWRCGGGLRALTLAALCGLPQSIRRRTRAVARTLRPTVQ